MNMPMDLSPSERTLARRRRRHAVIETACVALAAALCVIGVGWFAVTRIGGPDAARVAACSLGFVIVAWAVISWFADEWRRLNDHVDAGQDRCKRNVFVDSARPGKKATDACYWHG